MVGVWVKVNVGSGVGMGVGAVVDVTVDRLANKIRNADAAVVVEIALGKAVCVAVG